MQRETFTLVAKTFQGLEEVLANEIATLGGENIEIGKRMVSFTGDKELLYKTNLHCRTALRILKPIYTFTASDTDDLYDEIKAFDWSQYLTPDMTFSIDPVVYSDEFKHSKFVTYRAKDAIADHFREKCDKRPSVRLSGADILINLHINGTTCTLSLDSSGESLHKRGYRVAQTEAPLNEVLAAGLLLLAGWDGSKNFYDPMCGSGTLLIEAALIATGTPAGIYRTDFAFKHWNDYDEELFDALYNDDSGEHDFTHKIYGSDISPKAVEIATANIKSAGMSRHIDICVKPMQQYTEGEITSGGLLVTNPPYGERITSDDLMGLYEMIGKQLKFVFKGFEAWVISYRNECFDHIGLKASARLPMMNGALECEYRKFEIFDGKYSDFKRETGGFKREEKDDKPSFQRKDLKENARKARGGKRVFDARKEKGSDDKGDYRKRENRRDDQETRKPRFDRKNFDRSPEKEGGKYDERRVSKEEIIANNQQFTAAYDLDDEIKIGKYRRFRLHGDEAVRTYVKGRKPSIGEKKEKPTPRRNKRDNKK